MSFNAWSCKKSASSPRLDQTGREAAGVQPIDGYRLQNPGPPAKTEMRRNIYTWTGTRSCKR
jgi:hypothetical protein